MATDPGVQAFLETWDSLPADYVPQYDFAYSENDGGLYAFPASEKTKAPYLARQGLSFWNMPSEDPNPVTSQALATGQVPGAERIDAAGRYGSVDIDPKYAKDLDIWQRRIQAGNATNDEFSGLTAQIFGNAFTLPAAFAGAAMAANAFPGISTPGSLGSDAELVGGSGTQSLTGAALGAEGADTLGTEAALGASAYALPEAGALPLEASGLVNAATPILATGGGTAATTGLLSTLGAVAPYAPLISTGIGAIGAIVGGVQGANAAKDAANTQADAAREANNTLLQINAQNRADLAPYREAGTAALGQLRTLTNTPLTYGPYTATPALDPSGYAFAGPPALDPSGYAFTPAAPLDPSGYAFRPPSGQQVLAEDPGYAFRVSEGQKALERAAAGKGLLLSGGQLKDLTRFGQGQAAQEYAAAYTRRRDQNELAYGRGLTQNTQGYDRSLTANTLAYGRGLTQNQDTFTRGLTTNQLAYDRALALNDALYGRNRDAYTTNFGTLNTLRNTQYNELAGLAGTGQTATQNANTLNANVGTQLAANTTSAGAAQAAGQVGAANATTGIFTGMGSAANQYLNYSLLQQQLKAQQEQYALLSSLASRRAA